ncbi:MAG TPA: hypothetical protein VMQ54_00265 [Steroidobacteraceae bacterium]|jgi:hypothetical protein|nr:hypothetical protein [Steroidobacteraceae bacterium]
MEIETAKELPYVDRPDVVEAFSDHIRLTQFDGYSVRIEFAVSRPHVVGQNQSQLTIYPAARLALSPMAAMTLRDQLVALISAIETQGLLKRVAPSSGKKQ